MQYLTQYRDETTRLILSTHKPCLSLTAYRQQQRHICVVTTVFNPLPIHALTELAFLMYNYNNTGRKIHLCQPFKNSCCNFNSSVGFSHHTIFLIKFKVKHVHVIIKNYKAIAWKYTIIQHECAPNIPSLRPYGTVKCNMYQELWKIFNKCFIHLKCQHLSTHGKKGENAPGKVGNTLLTNFSSIFSGLIHVVLGTLLMCHSRSWRMHARKYFEITWNHRTAFCALNRFFHKNKITKSGTFHKKIRNMREKRCFPPGIASVDTHRAESRWCELTRASCALATTVS